MNDKKPGPGRPHSGKKMITLRLEPDIIEHYRATGKGWLARINETLRRSITARQKWVAKKTASKRTVGRVVKAASRAAKANGGQSSDPA